MTEKNQPGKNKSNPAPLRADAGGGGKRGEPEANVSPSSHTPHDDGRPFSEAELLRVTLASIGDGVITTDRHGNVTFLNPVAQELTGWTQTQAVSRSLTEVFHIVNQETRSEVENPALRALREGVIVGLANHTLLISKDGTERNIDDSAAPIKNENGEVAGSVLVFRDITERYRQETLVRQEREHAVNILRTLPHGFLVLDKNLRVVSANRSFYQKFHVEPEQTDGRLVYELGDGQWNIPKLRELLEEILPKNGHTVEDFEVEHEFPTIGKRVMSLNARRVNRPGNHSNLILLVIEDITERRQAEATKARLAAIVESSDDAIIGKDLNGIITSWNEGAQRLFGYTSQEVIGKPVTVLIPTDRIQEESKILERIGRGERVQPYETVRQRKDGSPVDISLTVSPVKDSAGRIIGAAKIARDIGARKRMEQELRESEIRYRRLFQTAKDGVLILDAHTGKIIDANGFMSALTGVEAPDLIGKELYEIGMFADESENRAAFRELQDKHYIRYDHLPIQNNRGEKVEVEVIANVYHEDHTLVAQCNVRDVSERMKMMNQIAQQAEAIASESRRKDEFLAMLSHELRNPLAPISSAVYLLRTQERAGNENPIQKQAHEIIERQVANLTKLVSDLLEVSRVVSGRIRLHQQVVDMNQVVRHAVETATPLIEQRKHELALNLSPEPVWCHADPTRLEEVFINLLNNAAKYTPDGGSIEVWCEHPDGTNHAQFRVRDNGMGIDEKLLPRIFDLFTQADRSLARSGGGLGVGLSLAHRLIDMHGGTIEARSDGPGTGAEFIVKLALAPAPAQVETAAPETAGVSNKPEGMRVLVVDDNIDLVMMLSSSLRAKGYSVQMAYTGPDALTVAQQWRPDVVLLDIGLPGLDGYEVARRLRTEPSGSEDGGKVGFTGRLIALTGYGREADIALAREAGFDGHLTKPVEFKEVEKMIAG